MKKRILFLIHDLGPGGAEKVLVNLANNLNKDKFDVTVMSLFDIGVNKQFIKPEVHYKSCFRHMLRGNSHLMKILSPEQLHRCLVKDKYDIEVAYLEGPSARIISGCRNRDTKLVSWIHVEQHSKKLTARPFRSYKESVNCYRRFNNVVFVSQTVQQDFLSIYPDLQSTQVLYNTNETSMIRQKKSAPVSDGLFEADEIKLIGVGKLVPKKGFDRLIRVHKCLRDQGYPVHTYILGVGSEQKKLEDLIRELDISDSFTLLGYHTNPYKYVSKCDLFVCASYAEGFSTAATEALIVGTPVCTVEVSGMKEMLGENNEYGIVTDNSEEALFEGIKGLLDNPQLLQYYRIQAEIRGKTFSTEKTVQAVEDMLLNL